MAISLKNPEVEVLLEKIARITDEGKTEIIKKALDQHLSQLLLMQDNRSLKAGLSEFLATSVWNQVPPEILGKKISKEEEEEILGFGDSGV